MTGRLHFSFPQQCLNIRQLLAGLTAPKAHADEIASTVCSSCLCQCEEAFERHEGAAFYGSVTL